MSDKNSSMKETYLLIIIFVFGTILSCNSQTKEFQDCAKCNIKVVLETDIRVDTLTKNDIYCFLKGFDTSCSNNVEYSEYSNEVLFKIVQKYPIEFIDILSKADIKIEYILEILKNPLLDYDLHKIKSIYLSNKNESKIKTKVIEALDKAIYDIDR